MEAPKVEEAKVEAPRVDKKNLLGLMRYWLFGTFVIVFAAVTIYFQKLTGTNVGETLIDTLPIWGITALLCIAWYYLYKGYLKRQK